MIVVLAQGRRGQSEMSVVSGSRRRIAEKIDQSQLQYELTSLTPVQENQGLKTSGIRQLRLFVHVGLVPPLGLDPSSTKSASVCLDEKG